MSRFFIALALVFAATPTLAQQYGPAVVAAVHFVAFMREGNKLRLVAIKPGTATVVLTEDKKLVWRAEVTVR